MIEIRQTLQKGRGVFAICDIPVKTTIEIAPVIVMSNHDRKLLDQTLLHDYIFEWGEDKKQCCMALGYVPVYNHSYKSNCEYEMNFEEETIRIHTISEVKKDEELTVNYNGDWNSNRRVWFDVK